MRKISIDDLPATGFDVVIVGAGVASAIVAKELAKKRNKVLVM